MAGGQIVGRQQGNTVTRDEARERAAAAAEARAQAAVTRGQQGAQPKIKATPKGAGNPGSNDGRVDLSDARVWD